MQLDVHLRETAHYATRLAAVLAEAKKWRQAVGMRNRIAHDYLDINEEVIFDILRDEAYQFAIDFLKWHPSNLTS